MRTLYNAFAEHVARRRAILRAVTIEYVKLGVLDGTPFPTFGL